MQSYSVCIAVKKMEVKSIKKYRYRNISQKIKILSRSQRLEMIQNVSDYSALS